MFFDHHIHSRYSRLDSKSEILDIIKVAKEAGMGGIAVSDHDTIEGSLKAYKLSSKDLLIIPSIEVSSYDGHIIGLGLTKSVERNMTAKDTISAIHDLGGLAIAAHPYDKFRNGVKDLCWKLDFDAVEINGHCLYGNSKAARAAKKHGKPLVGGSDAHSLSGIGAICTEVASSSTREIMENIKNGECKVVYNRNIVSLKGSILADKIARKYQKIRRG